MKSARVIVLTALLVLVAATIVFAAPTMEIPYTKKSTLAFPKVYIFKFSLYDAVSGGVLVWSEEKTVSLVNSKIITYLGDTVPLAGMDFSQQLYVQVERKTSGGYKLVGTRDRLGVVPYAIWSATSDIAAAGGSVTSVAAGTGLTGGGTGDVTLNIGAGSGISVAADSVSIATGGVTSAMIADSTIATADLANSAVTSAKLAADSVTTSNIVNGTITTSDFNSAVYGGNGAASTVSRSDHTHPRTDYIALGHGAMTLLYIFAGAPSSTLIFEPTAGMYNAGTGTGQYAAQLYLPQGATVTGMTTYYYDADATKNITVYLALKAHSGVYSGVNTSFTSSGSAGSYTNTLSTSMAVDNANYSYEVLVDLPPTATVGLRGILITYTMP